MKIADSTAPAVDNPLERKDFLGQFWSIHAGCAALSGGVFVVLKVIMRNQLATPAKS